jgi:hypothetical protein
MKLTPQAVDALLESCRAQEGDTDDAVKVEGIVRQLPFNPARVAEHATQIGELLAELPEQFQLAKGGGWSFLNACEDRHGKLWTGQQQTMETLFCLGIAAGKAKWLMPRDMWDVLPGGMPYVVVMP